MAKSHEERQFTQMAGEFGVVSELFRRQYQATITYGNSKSADVFVINKVGNGVVKVEVKSSVLKSWIVAQQAEKVENHIVWVFAHMPTPENVFSSAQVAEMGKGNPRYYVLTSQEVHQIYSKMKEEKGEKRGPIKFGLSDIQFNLNDWHKVQDAMRNT